MKVVIQRGVKDWVSHGRGYTNKVTEEVGEHQVTLKGKLLISIYENEKKKDERKIGYILL